VAYLPEGIEDKAGIQSTTMDLLGAMFFLKKLHCFKLNAVTKPSPFISNKHICLTLLAPEFSFKF
jgi:hypothetical protein